MGRNQRNRALILPYRQASFGHGWKTLCFLLALLLFSGWHQQCAFAKYSEAQLKQDYGDNLQSVPYFLRVNFFNQSGKGWPEASYDERKTFLLNYQQQAENDAKAKAVNDRQKYQQEVANAHLKQQKEKAKAMKLRQEAMQKQQEARAEEQKKREFAQKIKQMQQEENQLMRSLR